jgi:WD40 repeat protein
MPARSHIPGHDASSPDLSGEARNQLDQMRACFESAWRQGERPSVADYLTGVGGPLRVALLAELARLDLQFRRHAGEPARAEDYLDRFPELRQDPAAELALIVAEFRARRRTDPGCDTAEYLRRVPARRDELEPLLSDDPAPGGPAEELPDTVLRPPGDTNSSKPETVHPPSLGAGLSSTAPAVPEYLAPAQRPDEIGRLGPYRVLGVLGQGGMGTVFVAEDPQLRRQVALKVMRPSAAAAARSRERFLREARAAAAIHDDHIVSIHQVGEDRGIPFLVMPLLAGESLATRLQLQPRLSATEAVRIAREVAQGLAAAHRRGLIHRDIKPANVWLEAPAGRVKILDFGLARPELDAEALTAEGEPLGTPAYMPPEQVSRRRGTIGAWSDVYGLGVVLYQMLTGHTPFRGDVHAILGQILADAPTPPTALCPDLDPALAAIVLTALAKDPAQRYQSADEFIEALDRWTGGGSGPRRPRRTALAALAGGGALLLAGIIIIVIVIRERSGKPETLAPSGPAVPTVPTVVQKRRPADDTVAPPGRYPYLSADVVQLLGDPRWRWGPPRELMPDMVPSFAWAGKDLLAMVRLYDSVRVWAPATCRPHHLLSAPDTVGAAFAPDGSRVAMLKQMQDRWEWRIHDIPGPSDPIVLSHEGTSLVRLAFAPGGKLIATASGHGEVVLWDAATGDLLERFRLDVGGGVLAFSPDGKLLALGGEDVRAPGTVVVRLLDVAAHKERQPLRSAALRGPGAVQLGRIEFSADGRTLALGRCLNSGTGQVQLWDVPSGKEGKVHGGQNKAAVLSFALAADGKTLALGLPDDTVQVIDAGTGKSKHVLTVPYRGGGPAPGVVSLSFAPDGRTLVAASFHGAIRLWDVEKGEMLHGPGEPVVLLGATSDGKTLAVTNGRRGNLSLLDWQSTKGIDSLRLPADQVPLTAAFSADGKVLVILGAGLDGHRVRVWDRSTGADRAIHRDVKWIALAPDGKTLFMADQPTGAGDLWDTASGLRGVVLQGKDLVAGPGAFAPDGRTLATGNGNMVRLWDVETGKEKVLPLQGHTGNVTRLAYSAQATRLASVQDKGEAILWDLTFQGPAFIIKGPPASHQDSLAVSPDGKALFVGQTSGRLSRWKSEKERHDWWLPGGVGSLAAASDGYLIAGCGDGTVFVLRPRSTSR